MKYIQAAINEDQTLVNAYDHFHSWITGSLGHVCNFEKLDGGDGEDTLSFGNYFNKYYGSNYNAYGGSKKNTKKTKKSTKKNNKRK